MSDSSSDADLISYALVTLTVNRQETIAAFNRLLARERQMREAINDVADAIEGSLDDEGADVWVKELRRLAAVNERRK